MIEGPTREQELPKPRRYSFGGQTGEHSCDVNVTDITDGGAGIKTQGLAVLPLTFDLFFDNLRRKCRLVWRKGNSFGVTFEDHSTPTHSDANGGADVVMPGPALLALNDPPQLSYFDSADGWSEYDSKVSIEKILSNLAFALQQGSPSHSVYRYS